MARFPLFGTDMTGRSLRSTAQRRINVHCEVKKEGDRAKLLFYGTPGLVLFSSLGDTPIRGMRQMGDYLYVVHRGTLYEVNNAGVTTSKGTLATSSGRVSMDHNGTQVMMVDGTKAYTYDSSSGFQTVTSANLFANPTTVTFQDGYFIVTFASSGRFQVSASYDGTTWDALNYANAESSPDNLVNCVSDHGELVLFGQVSTEFWGNVGASDFTYGRIQGVSCQWGLAARWSVCKFGDSLAFLAKNRMGEVQPVVLNGYQPKVVGNDTDTDIGYLINKYTTVSDATSLSYLKGGHPFWQLNFPSAGKSWLFDGQTGVWSELQYGSMGDRHRAEIGEHFLQKTIVSDYSTGDLYKLDVDTYTDNGVPIVRELVGRHIFGEKKLAIGRLWLDFETGVGLVNGQGSDPKVMLQISRDGGNTYGNEHTATLGKIGEYTQHAIFRRLGSGDDMTFRVTVSDPVKYVLTGAWVDAA